MAERLGQRLLSERLADRLPQRLASAGFGGRVTIQTFVTLRLVLVTFGILAALAISAGGGASSGLTLLMAAVFWVNCFVAPGFVLGRRAAARRAEISEALPDALDLLAVTVEAGLGLHGAILHGASRLVDDNAS